MGNYRFRLSDMIPNAWFYKLKDMSKTKTHQRKPQSSSSNSYIYSPSTITKQPQNQHFSHPRNSIYYTPKVASQFQYNSPNNKFPHFHDPPRKSSKKVPKPNRKTIYKPSPKHTPTSLHTHTLQDFFHSPTTVSPRSSESTQSELATASWCTTCRLSSSTSDIIIDLNDTKKADFFLSPEKDLKLPPIITKQATKPIISSRNKQTSPSSKKVNQTPARKSISNGVKLRGNSPKLAVSKRLAQRKNMTESFAIVKSSFDPQKDFMESMMEMIIENNIKTSKDLEDLLACYLSLNSDEYHDVIVKAFEQIWFSLPNL